MEDGGRREVSATGIPRLVIAGTHSGAGKTTFTLGLLAALRRRGLAVQPFKVGPDYIDPSYHRAASGVVSRNLDSWMLPQPSLLELFERACSGADIAVVEGVMGVFDGFSGLDETGSTAQMARLLGAPVVLVLDVGSMARSAGALALGYSRYDPELWIGGFLLNNAGGETHYRWCKEAVEATGAGPVLGYLPGRAELKLPERHLGLMPTDERALPDLWLERVVELVESRVDLDALVDLARQAAASGQPSAVSHQPSVAGTLGAVAGTSAPGSAPLFPATPVETRATIAVARDEAFSFYYQDNLDLLRAHGARLLFFSPLRDDRVPGGADALYIGGGFPEVYAARLSANSSLLESVRGALGSGMPAYAECGGLMYLSEGIQDADGARHPMVGAVPGWCTMAEKRLSLGYVEVLSDRSTPLGPAATAARGHEFHWSQWSGQEAGRAPYRVVNQGNRPEGYARGNLLATFVHLHFGANPSLAPAFVASAAACRTGRNADGR